MLSRRCARWAVGSDTGSRAVYDYDAEFIREFNALFAKHKLQLMASEWLYVTPCDDPTPWELDTHGHLDPVTHFGPVYDKALAGHTQAELDERVRAAIARNTKAALARIAELQAETAARRQSEK